jgi:hypothetical protein
MKILTYLPLITLYNSWRIELEIEYIKTDIYFSTTWFITVKSDSGGEARLPCKAHNQMILTCESVGYQDSNRGGFSINNMKCDENMCDINIFLKEQNMRYFHTVVARCDATMMKGSEREWFNDENKYCYGSTQFVYTDRGVLHMKERPYY